MSEGGLPGMGLKLGPEVLRRPDGVWYSATGADGRTLGVLRFEPARVTAAVVVFKRGTATVSLAELLHRILPAATLAP